MVGCIRKLNNVKFTPKVITCRNYSAYESEVMKEDFRRVNWQSLYTMNDVNKALEYFNYTVKAIFDRHAPQMVKKVRGKPCPWINSDIRKTMSSRDCMLRKARRTKKVEHWNLYKKLQNACNNKMRFAKSTYHNDLLETASSPKKFWNIIKNIFPAKSKSISMSVNSKNDKNKHRVNIFSTYFANAIQLLKEKSMPLKRILHGSDKNTENIPN
ncbi:Hypothetical predicted protein [Paramuricea clavata]|uniref:Uncharacterized protein n=1 Tax=Paramuricea clavata TaxID=317549 RepID=A0A6S7GE58_PARCT|nr:Hypothetical predicted protein [Paramuricea clavata]